MKEMYKLLIGFIICVLTGIAIGYFTLHTSRRWRSGFCLNPLCTILAILRFKLSLRHLAQFRLNGRNYCLIVKRGC